jgi:diketogulonate reductase-like aldo/keto reductase
MNKQLLSRRQFSARCAAFGLSLPVMSATLTMQRSAPAFAATGAASETAGRTVRLPDGTTVPALGQGAWHLGQGRHPPAVEEEAVRTGISLGMTLVDTSGNYGNGRSEQFVGHVIADQRDRIFLVSKVESNEVSGDGIARACEASLARLGTKRLDLYLLHSPVPSTQFSGVVAAFEQLRMAGKIRAWGVSNFDRGQMEDLFRVPDGHRCATNQVAYSLRNRRIERDLLPWCAQQNMPVMAYSPLGGDNNLVVGDRTLAQIGTAHGCTAAAVALAWVIRSGKVIAITESGSPAHAKENAAALSITLTPQDIQTLAAAYPGPSGAT